jgi:hypothetical protein
MNTNANTNMSYGYIYCFSNASMQGILKIGITERTPEDRLREANASDTWKPPTPYNIEFAKKVLNPYQKEKTLHALLEQYTERIHSRREFFRVSLEEVRTFFDLMDGEMWTKAAHEKDTEHENEVEEKEEEKQDEKEKEEEDEEDEEDEDEENEEDEEYEEYEVQTKPAQCKASGEPKKKGAGSFFSNKAPNQIVNTDTRFKYEQTKGQKFLRYGIIIKRENCVYECDENGTRFGAPIKSLNDFCKHVKRVVNFVGADRQNANLVLEYYEKRSQTYKKYYHLTSPLN